MILYNNRVIPDWLRITGIISDNKRGVATLGKPIMQFTLNGKFIRSHDSLSEASASVNSSTTAISNAAAGVTKTSHGYIWKKI